MRSQKFIFLFSFFIFLGIFYASHTAFASSPTIVTNDISSDTTWTADQSPYIIQGGINVFSSATLTIEPGVVVKFDSSGPLSTFSVFGTIKALGEEHNEIYFTSNYDDEVGGSTDDGENCYDDTDADGKVVGQICESYDLGDPLVGDWGGFYFEKSPDSILENVSVRYAGDAFTINSSNLKFKNLSLTDSSSGLIVFNNSDVDIAGGVFSNLDNPALALFENSTFTGDNLKVGSFNDYAYDAIDIFDNADLSIVNSTFDNCPSDSCILFFDRDDFINNPSSINIENTIFSGGSGSGLFAFGDSNINAKVTDSSFGKFDFYGVENHAGFTINAQNNWWGDASGPYHPDSNPNGLGVGVTDNVLFDPWCTKEACTAPPPCTESCFSNVLFFPGLMGSRLYEKDGSAEKELWVSTSDSNQSDLLLDNSGESINSEIYTKDDTQKLDGDKSETGIVDEITLNNLPDPNIYKSFITDLKKWKNDDKIIEDYAFIPYDWRLSLDDIITNGAVADGDLSYNTSQDFSESFILKKLRALQKTSRTGKVTLIAHSNGGLVVKALVQKLKDTSDPLYDKIDKIIFVAVPQVGTPDAVAALLHGTELGNGYIMHKDRLRQLAENMPAVYNLLPSAAYFTTVDPGFAVDKVVSFEDVPFYDPQKSQYGIYVSNATELKNYILGTDGRTKPETADTVHPNIGNQTLYDQTENMHSILDAWQPSPDTKVIQVAGWGEETIAGLDYKTYNDVETHLSYKPRMVVDGDGTVVVPSALWMSDSAPNVERWWVNLAESNGGDLLKEVHRNILEISKLRDFVKSKITDSTYTDSENIIVNNNSSLTSNKSRLHFTLHSPLTLGITDAEGKYTGMDPVTKEIRQEIPGVDYRQIGDVQFISIPTGIQYTLELQGYADGYFSLDLEKQTGNIVGDTNLFEGIESSVSTTADMDIPLDFDVLKARLRVHRGNVIVDYPIVKVDVPTTPFPTVVSGGGGSVGVFQSIENEKLNVTLAEAEIQENVIQEPKIAKQVENKTVISEADQKPQEVQLSASVIDSGFDDDWILYVIILGIIILLFLIKKYKIYE